MGEGQSRIGYVDSGFSTQYTRDKPPGDGKIGHETAYRDTFSRPETAPAPYPWPGMKNRQPLKACFHRGADKEPRFYPLAMGAKDSSETLIAPPEGHGISADPKARFEGGYANKAAHTTRVSSPCSPRLLFICVCAPHRATSIFANPADIPPKPGKLIGGKNGQPAPPAESGYNISMSNKAAALIMERQDDGIKRTPALTMLQRERVQGDSTARYFHARDFYDQPFLSSSKYYENDNVAQFDARGKVVDAGKYPPIRSTFAMAKSSAALNHSGGCWRWCWWCFRHADWKRCRRPWGGFPSQPRVGLLPGYATNYPPETKPYGGGKEPPSALQYLPEKFRRMHIRNTHLQWGGEKQYESTAEPCHPRVQEPLGGKLTETDVNVTKDFSGRDTEQCEAARSRRGGS